MLIKKLTLPLTALLLIMFNGCAGLNWKKFDNFQEPSNSENAMIYIYSWPYSITTKLMPPGYVFIKENGKDLLLTKYHMNSYTKTEIQAGRTIELWASAAPYAARPSVKLFIEKNKIYCFKADYDGFMRITPTFAQVDMETCKKEIANSGLIE